MRTLHFVLGGLVNNNDNTINVTGVSGGLFDPTNTYAKYFNVTAVTIKTPVPAGDEISLEFPFQVPAALPRYPFPMQLIATVVYEDESGKYSSVLFNSTVTFVAKDEAFDPLGWLPSVATLGCLALFFALLLEASPSLGKVLEAVQDEAAPASSSSSATAAAKSGSAAPGATKTVADILKGSGYRAKLVALFSHLEQSATKAQREALADEFLASLNDKELPESALQDRFVYAALAGRKGEAAVMGALKKEGFKKEALQKLFE